MKRGFKRKRVLNLDSTDATDKGADMETTQEPEPQEKKQRFSKPQEKKQKVNEKNFPYGNYDKYYELRREGYASMKVDPRIAVFQQHIPSEYLKDKNCLDIGCNAGLLTCQISEHLHCSKIVGVDIDNGLIRRAQTALIELKETRTTATSNATSSSGSSSGNVSEQLDSRGFPNNISFLTKNYALPADDVVEKQTFDAIFCMSVTKWIHLNFGDEGIKAVFTKVYNSLSENGVFIVEPQNWRSYKKRKNLTKNISQIYPTIKLRPNEFTQYLLQEVGFKAFSSTLAEVKEKGDVHKEFNRPIFFYYKGKAPAVAEEQTKEYLEKLAKKQQAPATKQQPSEQAVITQSAEQGGAKEQQ